MTEKLQDQLLLPDLINERYPGQLKRCGNWLKGRSPYRDDHNASFGVRRDINFYKDFGTGEHGGLFDWLRLEYGYDYRQACEFLAARLNGAAQTPRQVSTARRASASEPPPAAWQNAMLKVLAKCATNPQARAFLTDQRGLTPETIEQYRLFYNPRWLKIEGIHPDGEPVFVRPGILIPLFADGALWGIKIRTRTGKLAEALGIAADHNRDGSEPDKYLHVRGGQGKVLFNADAITPGCDVLIVEGEFDSILAQQELGQRAAVVTFGAASNVNFIPRRWLERLKTAGRVFIATDNDQAGQQAATYLEQATGGHRLPIPAGKDISEYAQNHGGDIAAWFEAATQNQTPAPPKSERYHPDGLPDSWRSALLNYAPDVMPIEELYTAACQNGLINPEAGFTVPELKAANEQLGLKLTRKTFEVGIVASEQLRFFTKMEIENPPINTMSKQVKNPGRPAARYIHATIPECRRLLVHSAAPVINERKHGKTPCTVTPRMMEDWHDGPQLAHDVNRASQQLYRQHGPDINRASRRARAEFSHLKHELLDNLTSTPLAGSIENATAARIAFFNALKTAGFEGGQREIAQALGVNPKTVNRYAEAAGCEVVRHEPVPERFTNPDTLKSQVDAACKAHNGAPAFIGTATGKARYTPASAAAIIRAEKSVTIYFQPKNEYILRPDAQPQAQPAPTAPAATNPAPRPARPAAPVIELEPERLKSGYSRLFIRERLIAILRTWKPVNGTYQNPETGVLVDPTAPLETLLSEIVGYQVQRADVPRDSAEMLALGWRKIYPPAERGA